MIIPWKSIWIHWGIYLFYLGHFGFDFPSLWSMDPWLCLFFAVELLVCCYGNVRPDEATILKLWKWEMSWFEMRATRKSSKVGPYFRLETSGFGGIHFKKTHQKWMIWMWEMDENSRDLSQSSTHPCGKASETRGWKGGYHTQPSKRWTWYSMI